MNRLFLIPTLFLLALGIVCFLVSAGGVAPAHQIVFCNGAQIHTLDPAGMSWSQDIRVAEGLWEGLTQFNPKTLDPEPGVAQRWTISPDGRTYTFFLRHDARWTNGAPVVAADFVFAWKRMLHPAAAAAYLEMLFHLAGGRTYYNGLDHHGPRQGFSSVGVRAVGRYKLVVHLAGPCPYFLSLTAFPPFFPLNRASMRPFKIAGGQGDYDAHFTRPPHLVTNGPFRLAAWKFHQYLDLVPNKYYWDASAVQCPRLRIVAYANQQTAFLAYESHAVNVLSFIPAQFGWRLLKQQRAGLRHDIHETRVFGTYYYIFNCQKFPTNQRLVRLALALAINKRTIVNNITRMGQRPVNVLVPPDSIPGYSSPRGLGENVPLARRFLARAGFPGGRGFPTLDFLTNDQPAVNSLIAQAIAQMWQKNLGVHIRLRQEESKSFHTDMVAGHFQIARAGWYGDYRDPTTFLDLARTGNPNNLGQFSDPKFDRIMHASDMQPNPAARFKLLQTAERLLVDRDMPFIPLYQYTDGLIYHARRIGGIYPNVQMVVLLKYLRKIGR